MALPPRTGIYDSSTNSFVAPNTGTWANLTSWSSWINWTQKPAETFTFVTDIYERGPIDYFNIVTQSRVANGTITYRVFTSNTGNFSGEETITTITPNSNDISAFYGKYYAIEANVASTGGLARLESLTVTSTDASLDLKFNNIETANLTQTANGAVISLPRLCSAVLNMQITLHDANFTQDYDTDFSYIEMPTYRMPQALITGKQKTGPTFVLRDMFFGTQLQANVGYTIDARVTVLPEQIHDGQNLITR